MHSHSHNIQIYHDGVIFFLYFSYRCNYIITQLLVLSVTVSFFYFILFYDYCVQLFSAVLYACACGSAYSCTFESKQLDIVHSKIYGERCVLLFLYLFLFCMHMCMFAHQCEFVVVVVFYHFLLERSTLNGNVI